MPNLGPMELAIIAVVILVLFGGARLAGLGKSTGRALREFKEETKSLKDDDKKKSKDKNLDELEAEPTETVDAEIVDKKHSNTEA
ncbi:twin-arginine translocase TatA/TatE family subunit [Propionibacteriaceae bacterium Y1685]|uniref:twin-arginine translocase TatA/TatE family subunit n=1 Tax=Microlunatus sp. Y1700 TaxID=3418487 RepID=UPI003B7DDC36